MNLFDQTLANRAQRVLKSTDGESNRTPGLEIFSDRIVGSTSSSKPDETEEADCCLGFVRAAMAIEPTEALAKHLCRRGGSPMEPRIETVFLSVDWTTRVNSYHRKYIRWQYLSHHRH